MSEISKFDQSLISRKVDARTINIQINDNEMLMSIVGEFNKNLKELEKLTKTTVFFRGNSITCKGKETNLKNFSDSIKFLVDKYLLTKIIEKEDVILSTKNKDMKLEETNIKSFSQLIRTPKKSVIARSEKQSDYKSFKRKRHCNVNWTSRDWKSFLAVSVAVTLLMEKKLKESFFQDLLLKLGEIRFLARRYERKSRSIFKTVI